MCLSVCVYSAFVEVYWSFILLLLSYLKLRAKWRNACAIFFFLCFVLFCSFFDASFITFSFFTTRWLEQHILFYSNTCKIHLLLICTTANKCTIDKLSQSSYMFRHYRVILREFPVNTLPSYTSRPNAVVTYSMEQSPSWEANWFCS